MFYVMKLCRDDWGNTSYIRIGQMFKKQTSVINYASKLTDANVFKYGKKVPIFTTEVKLKGILNDYWGNHAL